LSKYEKELNEFAEEIARLKGVADFLKTLEDATTTGEAETTIKSDIDKKEGYLGRIRDSEKEVIDDKYTQALFEGTKHGELEGDIKALVKEENDIYEKLKTTDPYNATAVKADLAKVQATLRKKKADIGVLERKYKKSELIEKWEATLKKMDAIKNTIDSEKTKDEKTIANKTVKDEMKKLFDKEIKRLKEEYLIAQFKEGDESKLTKSEKEKFEKKDRPIESAKQIKDNLDSLKTQYLDIAGKLGFFEKIQGEITLLNDDFAHIKELKTSKESEKKKIDDKLREISTELGRIGSSNPERAKTLKEESATLQAESTKKEFETTIKKLKLEEENYKDYIKALKQISNNNDAQKKYKELYDNEKYGKIIKTLQVQAGGGKGSRKRKIKRRRKTKRLLKHVQNKKRTVRKKGHRRRKYTK
jgi:hypothetical protein